METIGRNLNPEEQAVLAVLAQEGRSPRDRTAAGIAMALERDPVDVAGVLSRLEKDGLTSGEDDAGERTWSATEDGAQRL